MDISTATPKNLPAATGLPAETAPGAAGTVTAAAPAPLLDGPSVTVSGASDLQRLMDELKLKQEETRRNLTLRQFGIALQQLAAQNEHLTEAQTAAIGKVTDASSALEAARNVADSAAQDVADGEKAVAEAQKTLDGLLADLAKAALTVEGLEQVLTELKAALAMKTSALDVMIEALNDLVEAQKKSREEREKEIRAKEEKAEASAEEMREKADATAEDDKLQHEIDDLKGRIADLQLEIAGLQGQVDTVSGQVTAGKEALAAQKQAVATAQNGLKAAQDQLAAAQAAAALAKGVTEAAETNLAQALAALDGVSLAAVAAALQVEAVKVLEEPDGADDGGKADEKAEAIRKLAEDLSRAIEERKDDDLEKLVAKLPDALDWFARHAVPDRADADLPDFKIQA